MNYWDEYCMKMETIVNNVSAHNIVPDWHIISVAEYTRILKECNKYTFEDIDIQYAGLCDLEYYEQWLQHKK